MNKFMKIAIVVVIFLYIVSPADAFPGPIDDILAVVLGISALRAWDKD